ncbi:MAG: flagellar basal body P-ring formation chaperone FlgA [Devosia sp.]
MNALPLALAALLALVGPAFASPVLRGDVTVTHPVVTIGDVFDDAGDLAGTAIFRAPAPGTTGTVALADLTRAARSVGLTEFDALGRTTIQVARATTVVDGTMLGSLISTELAARGLLVDGLTADTRFDVADLSLYAERSDAPAKLVTLRYAPGSSAFAARFLVTGIDKPVDLTGTIQLMTSVPRLNANIAAGAILAADDFDVVQVALSTAQAGGYADLEQLVGKQLLRQSRSGIMLKPTDVSDPVVVTRSAMVTVLFRSGAMTLSVKGQALGNAAAGQPVDVMNTLTKKILHGIAQPDGSVAVTTLTTVAAL